MSRRQSLCIASGNYGLYDAINESTSKTPSLLRDSAVLFLLHMAFSPLRYSGNYGIVRSAPLRTPNLARFSAHPRLFIVASRLGLPLAALSVLCFIIVLTQRTDVWTRRTQWTRLASCVVQESIPPNPAYEEPKGFCSRPSGTRPTRRRFRLSRNR